MAVAPISFGSPQISRDVDFASMGQQLTQAYQQRQKKELLQSVADGNHDPQDLIRVGLATGDIGFANLGQNMIQRQQEAQRQAQQDKLQRERYDVADKNSAAYLDIARRNAARADDKTPTGFEADPTTPGSIRPIPGGPQSPQFKSTVQDADFSAGIERRKRAATGLGLVEGTPQYQQYVATETYSAPKPRDLPSGVVKDMNEKGGTYEDFNRLSTNFSDAYGGYKTGIAGDVANLAARNLGIGNTEGATWWQEYQNQKNIVRNKLFGSALTSTEKGEFDKANINPGMTSGAIRANLKIQTDASRRAAAKLANTYTKMGYSADQIEAALGMPVSEINSPKPAPAPATPSQGNRTSSGVQWSIEP